MIGFHFQSTVNDWPRAVAVLPAGTPVKAVDRPDILREAKQTNNKVLTILRHWYDQGQHYDGAAYSVLINRATTFFSTFIDGTFMSQYAPFVDVIETWNETLANSQSDQERQWRIDQERAMCEVWASLYADMLPHVKLCLANAAVGNDIPAGIAALAHQYDHYLGYHPYLGVKDGEIDWNLEKWLSLRHMAMDSGYRAAGFNVRWLFTEGGPVRDAGGGQLDPMAGWRHPGVCNANRGQYASMMAEWAHRVSDWNRIYGNRARGVTLFTSYNINDPQWRWFHTGQPEMDMLAQVAIQYPPGGVEPPPPPPPPPGDCRGKPRIQYDRVYQLVHGSVPDATATAIFQAGLPSKRTTGYSADDAGIGDLDARHVDVFGWPDNERPGLVAWYAQNYPGVTVAFKSLPTAGYELVADISQWQGHVDWQKMRAMMQDEGLE